MSVAAWPVVLSPVQREMLAELAAGRSRRSVDGSIVNDLLSMGLVDVQVGDVFLTDRGRLFAASLGLPNESDDSGTDNGIYS